MARPVRYRIVGLLFSGTVINYIDRVNISVAAPVIMDASGWSKSELGTVFSAFLVGYSVLQLPGGLVADRWSARESTGHRLLWLLAFHRPDPTGRFCLLAAAQRPFSGRHV